MTVVEAVRDRLLTISALTALIGSRIYALELPQKPTLPAIRLQQITGFDVEHLRGSGGPFRARVQMDTVGSKDVGPDPYNTAHGISLIAHGSYVDGVATGLVGWRGSLWTPPFMVLGIRFIDMRELQDPDELRQIKVIREYEVAYRM